MIPQILDALLRSVQGSSVTEIEYHANGQRFRLVRQPHAFAAAEVPSAAVAAPAVIPAVDEPAAAKPFTVRAGMHGTFYRAAAPDQPPLVDLGQRVEAGQQLALLEAMKMLHAVEAECAGRIARILSDNGAPVEPGAPLFEIAVEEGGDV